MYLLHERMGYHELAPAARPPSTATCAGRRRSRSGGGSSDAAAQRGRRFGVKMTNTLVVENHKKFLAGEEMYLSGPPLHVLAMHCVERWRAALGTAMPLSFSGGIDQHNFVDAVACDLVPVTTCTDLLRPGGYGRLSKYLENLEEAMVEVCARESRRAHPASASAKAPKRCATCWRWRARRPARPRRKGGATRSSELLAALKGAPTLRARGRPAGRRRRRIRSRGCSTTCRGGDRRRRSCAARSGRGSSRRRARSTRTR